MNVASDDVIRWLSRRTIGRSTALRRRSAAVVSGADAMRVKLFKPDTGLQITYTFRRAACWTLVRIEDDSL